MSNQLGKVRMDTVAACMTCSLCDKLFEEATTISLCLHTFCRKCIYERLSDDECDSCPVCEVTLGCNPVDKLRPDHNLQDIRAKLFPIKIQILEAPEAVPSVSPPIAKRKERSLSSLVVDTPRVPVQASMMGRRTRAKKASARSKSSLESEELSDKEEALEDEDDEELSSPETLNKIMQNKKQPPASVKSSNSQVSVEGSENNKEQYEAKVDLWKPLNCLVEAANRTKFSKLSSQGPSHGKAEPSNASDSVLVNFKAEFEENGHRQEIQDDVNHTPSTVSAPTKRKNRVRASKKNLTSTSGDASNPPQFVLEAVNQLRRDVPVWFSLVASREQQEISDPLPQIPANYVRITNGNMPVSSIQKYIVKKLDLPNDTEVEILCNGSPVPPALKLRSLLELWLATTNHAKRIKTYVGCSGRDYVMVLTYSRRVQAPAHEVGTEPQVKLEPQTQDKEQSLHHEGDITANTNTNINIPTTATTTTIKQIS